MKASTQNFAAVSVAPTTLQDAQQRVNDSICDLTDVLKSLEGKLSPVLLDEGKGEQGDTPLMAKHAFAPLVSNALSQAEQIAELTAKARSMLERLAL